MFRIRMLQGTALVIAIVMFGFGLAYLFVPVPFQAALGLTHLPLWSQWPFGMLGARFLVLGYGMLVVVRHPTTSRSWIQAMIFVQVVDWLVLMTALLRGVVTLSQVALAPYLPIVFVVCLLIAYPRTSMQQVPSDTGRLAS
ncbi:MAG: hypothetical protein H0W02_07845 [Ktedonobacteraceae bacterium]|nr:hypothetical protein [Ktedonobacteraceae bacterium]